MKLLLREYLGALRERGELDAILPDLLSALGHTVLWRPGVGTTQHGVDFASVGPDENGRRTLYLFVIKAGDLTRADWSATPQGVQASLDEILYVFLKTRVRPEHKKLPVAICICFGGDYLEPVQLLATGYIEQHTTSTRRYEIWHGDHLANALLSGVLREDLLPKPLRSSFQKALAMLDEPDVAVHHFGRLVAQLLERAAAEPKAKIAALRQLYIALWVLYVWARDAENLEAPCKASELAVLASWEMVRPHLGKKSKATDALLRGVDQVIKLHIRINESFLESRVFPHADKLHALSLAVGTRRSLDINLRLFDLLGRLTMQGLWLLYLFQRATEGDKGPLKTQLDRYVDRMFALIANNPSLCLPVKDEHATEVALALILWSGVAVDADDGRAWIAEMVGRLGFALKSHGLYTCHLSDYADLAVHPVSSDEAYRQEVTQASTLVPLLAAWAHAAGLDETVAVLDHLAKTVLAHCSFQTWLPDATSEDALYIGGATHGAALTDLPVTAEGVPLLALLAEEAKNNASFHQLSAIRSGMWPVALMAFRAQRLPIPPTFWIDILAPAEGFPPYADVAVPMQLNDGQD
ncbi:MAG: hypothetical protein J7521_07160 [Caulobacter sp.]|nr:hypothetical protein [Caulobacter sp.]